MDQYPPFNPLAATQLATLVLHAAPGIPSFYQELRTWVDNAIDVRCMKELEPLRTMSDDDLRFAVYDAARILDEEGWPEILTQCQTEIAEHIARRPESITQHFTDGIIADTPEESEELLQAAQTPGSWSFKGVFQYGQGYQLVFNCDPFEDQIRAYVSYDLLKGSVQELEICGE